MAKTQPCQKYREFWRCVKQIRQFWRCLVNKTKFWSKIRMNVKVTTFGSLQQSFWKKGWTNNSINSLLVKFWTVNRRPGSGRRSEHRRWHSRVAGAEPERQTSEPPNIREISREVERSIDHKFRGLFASQSFLNLHLWHGSVGVVKSLLLFSVHRTFLQGIFRWKNSVNQFSLPKSPVMSYDRTSSTLVLGLTVYWTSRDYNNTILIICNGQLSVGRIGGGDSGSFGMVDVVLASTYGAVHWYGMQHYWSA